MARQNFTHQTKVDLLLFLYQGVMINSHFLMNVTCHLDQPDDCMDGGDRIASGTVVESNALGQKPVDRIMQGAHSRKLLQRDLAVNWNKIYRIRLK